MPAIHILYESDHKDRAQALTVASANTATSDQVDANPKAIEGLTTLIFWGHGSATGLCQKPGAEIVRIIRRWKSLNPNLDTVEIITCNSRHFDDDWFKVKNAKGKLVEIKPKVHLKSRLTHLGKGKKINNSMAKVVKRGLKYDRTSALRAISVKSMPESVEGSFGRYSILYWDKVTFTWCYVTGESEEAMFEMGNNIKLTKRVPYDPARKWGGARQGDFSAKVAAAKIEFPDFDYSDVITGTIGELRGILTAIN